MKKYEFIQFCDIPKRFRAGLVEKFPEAHSCNLFCKVFDENGEKNIYPVVSARQDFTVLKDSNGKEIYIPFEESFEEKMKECGKYALYGDEYGDGYCDIRRSDFQRGIEHSIKRVFQRYLDKILRIETGNLYDDELEEDSSLEYIDSLAGIEETAMFVLTDNFYDEDEALRTIMFWYVEVWRNRIGTATPDFKYMSRRSFFEKEYKNIFEANK